MRPKSKWNIIYCRKLMLHIFLYTLSLLWNMAECWDSEAQSMRRCVELNTAILKNEKLFLVTKDLRRHRASPSTRTTLKVRDQIKECYWSSQSQMTCSCNWTELMHLQNINWSQMRHFLYFYLWKKLETLYPIIIVLHNILHYMLLCVGLWLKICEIIKCI